VAGISTQHQPAFPLRVKPSCGTAVISLITALLTSQIFAQQSSLSLATMLETKISVEVNSFSLAGAIKNLRAEINDEIPEFKNTNIVCDGLNRTSVAEFKKVSN
jgi:hypothetical protein